MFLFAQGDGCATIALGTTTNADGAKVQEVLDGVHRSSAQGRWVETGGGRFSIARP